MHGICVRIRNFVHHDFSTILSQVVTCQLQVCVYAWECVQICVCLYAWKCVHFMYVCVHAWEECAYLCMFVCMEVCAYLCICAHAFVSFHVHEIAVYARQRLLACSGAISI